MARVRIRLDAYGRLLAAEHDAAGWRIYDLSSDGKRRPATDLIVPDFLTPDEIATYLGDLLHEHATPRHPEVRILARSH